jgi:acetyl esterase
VARDRKDFQLVYQMLLYPALSCQFDSLSYELFNEGFFLTREDMKCLCGYYVQGQDAKNPYISPLKATNLNCLPPTLLVVADYDVLRDEALAYGWRLQAAGVPLSLKKYGSVHGFLGLAEIDLSKQALKELTESLKKALNPEST